MYVQTSLGKFKFMLREEDQKALLELLAINAVYLNVVTEPVNPFVKILLDNSKQKALDLLIRAVNNLEHLVPMAMTVSVENEELTEEKVDLTNFE